MFTSTYLDVFISKYRTLFHRLSCLNLLVSMYKYILFKDQIRWIMSQDALCSWTTLESRHTYFHYFLMTYSHIITKYIIQCSRAGPLSLALDLIVPY